MEQRRQQLNTWLDSVLNTTEHTLTAITNDASFRRYFRVKAQNQTWIAMDAPPAKEPCEPFIDIAGRLRAAGLQAPEIIAQDLSQGFLLLTDFGDKLYLPALTSADAADPLYQNALQTLVKMQTHVSAAGLPPYDNDLLHQEMHLFPDWLLREHLHCTLTAQETDDLQACFQQLADSAIAQPQVFVHRDYHSRNLMILSANGPALLDFQDAVHGPVTYDLVSLLRDCYIVWPTAQLDKWLGDYYRLAQAKELLNDATPDQFRRWFDWIGLQRHIKIAGIFARLNYRDGKSAYLADIPTALNYILDVGKDYSEMAFLTDFISRKVLPGFEA